MREIKFRAWDKKHKVMFEVMVIDFVDKKVECYKDKGKSCIHAKGKLKDIELMQFTGLKDKNGKEIYEGDIFDCIYKSEGCEHKLVVVWNEDSACFRIKNYGECEQPNVSKTMLDLNWVEVIGNKFKNSELLK